MGFDFTALNGVKGVGQCWLATSPPLKIKSLAKPRGSAIPGRGPSIVGTLVSRDNGCVPMPVSEVPFSDRRGLRIKEAAIYLGTSPWWVEIAIREKRLPAYKFNTNYYVIFKDDL